MRIKPAKTAQIVLAAILFSTVALVVAQGSAPQALPIHGSQPEPLRQPSGPGTEPAEASATILELEIPNFPLQKWYNSPHEDGSRGTRTLDLWVYTTYDENLTALTYTSDDNSSYMDWEIVDVHFLSMTVTTRSEKDVPIHVKAEDGALTASDTFVVRIRPGPYIDFYDVYGGYPLEDPLVVGVGQHLDEPLDLDYYSGNKAGEPMENQTFSVVNSAPASLGISIYTDPDAGPYDCENCLDMRPTGAATGMHQVEVQITNGDGLTATDTFNVQVVRKVFLPTILKDRTTW
jgi:hypothetical protein